MNMLRTTLVIATSLGLGLAGCSGSKSGPAAEKQGLGQPVAMSKDPVLSAQSAAPQTVGADATIVMANADGTLATLRQGTNGFTCMPDNPITPGKDPMCMDGNALKWAMAWMKHEPPPLEMPGLMYMLSGGTDASNTDPFATGPAPGNDWVRTGPHVMVVGSARMLGGYPSGHDPDTSMPYVMWAGTPYAHLMVPVG